MYYLKLYSVLFLNIIEIINSIHIYKNNNKYIHKSKSDGYMKKILYRTDKSYSYHSDDKYNENYLFPLSYTHSKIEYIYDFNKPELNNNRKRISYYNEYYHDF